MLGLKKQMAMEGYGNASGAYTIIINNARYQGNYPCAIEKMIEYFLDDKEVFLGFCRTDCANLTKEQQGKLENEVPAFFVNMVICKS